MISSLLRCLLPLTLALLVVACAALPRLSGSPPPADELFLQALGEMPTATAEEAFETLRREYPDSPWTSSAQSIKNLQQAHAAQDAKIQALQQDKSRLLQENRKLKEDLEKLRKLVIETERRRR